MSVLIYNLFLRFFLVAQLFLPGITALVTGGEYGESQGEYSRAMDERERLMGELSKIEGQYQKFVADIEKLKRSGQDGLKNRRDLEGLLRQSRQVADELESLQGRIRQVDGRLETQRRRMLGAIDERIRELERSIASVPASERGEIVRQLNTLRVERQKYAAPMPPLPDHRRVLEALEMASALDSSHPAELLAAADELEDTEDQVRRRLAAIEARLGELQQARRLSRRAQSFSREESFFEEGDRSRLIARYDRVTRAGADGPREEGEVAVGGDESDDIAFAAPEAAPAPPESAGSSQDEQGFDGVMDGAAPDPGVGRDQPTAEPTGPTAPPPSFEDHRETVVFESSVDPSRAVGNIYFQDANLDRNIEQLEDERKRLERQAGELRNKAEGLRKSAREALD